MINKLYKGFLWFAGFAEGETITAMLRRQKLRLKVGWWAMVTLPCLFVAGGYTWLILHVLGAC